MNAYSSPCDALDNHPENCIDITAEVGADMNVRATQLPLASPLYGAVEHFPLGRINRDETRLAIGSFRIEVALLPHV